MRTIPIFQNHKPILYMKFTDLLLALLLVCLGMPTHAQEDTDSLITEATFKGLKLRSIGPALMAGRIADIAIHPEDDNNWYVAVGSGGVWHTQNAGNTWKPIFDDQASYSIGCITLDPGNPNTVWVGTGENVGGRHVGYGDGIYRSDDGGATWKNMGLKDSEHLSKIIVHPENSDVVWVAAQGPLWSSGGQRGLYMTTDGGKTWTQTLGDDEWVGVTDVVIDPRNPNRLYAATWQRHRTVAAYMGGGPGTGLYKSSDGGLTWEELKKGLPQSNMGKIGLAISPQDPDVLYAAIELDRRTGGVYRSDDKGATWEKRSETVSGGTGPHYYQELYASPHAFDRLYLMDVRIQVSDDGGKSFRRLKEENKHSDNHAMAFRQDDPDYLLIGTDGGLYESFDLAENWRFFANMPITQFYKVAVDDAEPFYNIYGGTQDNNTQVGPSRTGNYTGIANREWSITIFADGHQPATEPGNPNIAYSEWQQGNLVRLDRKTGEWVYIQPQPAEGEPAERFNWDSPILVSPHSPSRLYFASQRVWRSDNRGDSWTAISADLTQDQERITLPIMGSTQSWDAPWDFLAMSTYNTITSLAESPQQEWLIYAGTDDGIIQVTEDGGENWRKIAVGTLPGVPETAFVNDIKADLFDANTVYVALDNHKYGDYQPYLLKSTDRGASWTSISSNIPDRTLVWRLVQDHVNPDLMFAATEFGIYFTIDGGGQWTMLKGGVPNISFRDLAIQRRENDLVGASFGRSFYVLDDYSPLRQVSDEMLAREATLFKPRKAWWYVPRPALDFDEGPASQGAGYFVAPNPPYGAVFTYYLKEGLKSKKQIRQASEKELAKQGEAIAFPGWDAVEAERREPQARIWLTVSDSDGKVIRRIPGKTGKGFHRVAWDLTYPSQRALREGSTPNLEASAFKVAPGTYTVSLSKEVDGVITELSTPQTVEVVRMEEGTLEGSDPEVTAAFWRELESLQGMASAARLALAGAMEKVKTMKSALALTELPPGELDSRLHALHQDVMDLDVKLNGHPSKDEVGEKYAPTISSRLGVASRASQSTYGPTQLAKENMAIAKKQLDEMMGDMEAILNDRLPELEKALREAGAPWIEGMPLPDTGRH